MIVESSEEEFEVERAQKYCIKSIVICVLFIVGVGIGWNSNYLIVT
jgi:hypothetical protein